MKQYFICKEQKQYRANLHCHSVYSDGKCTPEQLKDGYKAHGYSILAITDHECPKNHSHLNDQDFLMITGYEAYIRPDPNCIYDRYASEIHMNLIAKEPSNVTAICYNENYLKYISPEEKQALPKAGSQRTREYTVEYVNEFIRTANENGYLVTYNHPTWSMEEEARILAYENIFSLEIDNYSAHLINRMEHNGALYDKMLRMGKRIFCHGSDDNHNPYSLNGHLSDSYGAWTMILAKELSYPAVIEAMEKGEMYSSTGPQIFEVSYEDGVVHVECSPAEQIILFCGSKSPFRAYAPENGHVTIADLPLDEKATYFRVAVVDEKNHVASTRGFFRDELK